MSAAITWTWLAVVAAPNSAGLPDNESKEIVVTGERIPRSLRETASSVAVITGEAIDTGPAEDRLEQILALIPNVQLGGGGGPTIRGQDTTGAIRDLPGFLGGSRPRTTIVVDGRAVSFNEFVFGVAPLWDVDRIEVFRTPQTTTQGRNSIAGAIFIHSRDPTYEWEGRVRAIGANLHTRHLSATASGPIIENQLAFRVSGDWRKSRTSTRIVDRLDGFDPNRDEYALARFKLLAEPAALLGMRIELAYAHTESEPGGGAANPPFRERRSTFAAVFRNNVESLTTVFTYEPGDRIESRTTVTLGDARVRRFSAPGLGQTRSHLRDWSAESVIDWKPLASVRATGGLSLFRADLEQFIDLSQLAGIGQFDDRQRSYGVFGEVSWKVLRRAELTAGLRYQNDRQERRGVLGNATINVPLDYERRFDAWLPKVTFTYDFSGNLLAGLMVQRAYNPGGVSLRFDTGLPDEFEAERLWNYELFARASLGRQFQARLNLFRMDITDAQRSRPIPILAPTGRVVTFADLYNVAGARSQGLELEVDWQASSRFSIRGAVGLLDTKITDDAGAPISLDGNQFQRSPHFTGTLAIDWRPTDALQLTAQVKHNGGYFSTDANEPGLRVGTATVVDARASWREGPFTLFAYARNLFDEFYKTAFFNAGLATVGEPRELGLGIEANF